MSATIPSIPLNPYIVGGAIGDPSGRGFYGREDVFDAVRSALASVQRAPLLLLGQRRMGKSSVLRQLPQRLPENFVCVFFDLQGKASMELDQVLYGLARAIADEIGIPKPERADATEDTFQSNFLNSVIAHLGGHPERLVLLLDEFDVVDERFGGGNVAASRFIDFLGELNARHPQIGLILVVGRKSEELSGQFNAALLKNSLRQKIDRLDREHVDRLVVELSHGYLLFGHDALARIYELAAGQPFCTQVLCNTIWSRHVTEETIFPVKISAGEVDNALVPAIDRGTNGLNWIFDGLTSPSHRLFLSAMAKVVDPASGAAVSTKQIEELLRSRRIPIDERDFAVAPRELRTWDIIVRNEGHEKNRAGFCFAVPMVGVWIRRERSLEQLERDARFANPRAFQYFELASQAHQTGDLDRAINDYRGAIQAHPAFLEAHKGLAAALHERHAPGDFDAAIETRERIHDIEPEGSTVALLDSLLASLDEPDTAPDKLIILLKRIREVDSEEGVAATRAKRVVLERASALMSTESYDGAALLYTALGFEQLGRSARRLRLSRNYIRTVWIVLGVVAGVVAWPDSFWVSLPQWMQSPLFFYASGKSFSTDELVRLTCAAFGTESLMIGILWMSPENWMLRIQGPLLSLRLLQRPGAGTVAGLLVGALARIFGMGQGILIAMIVGFYYHFFVRASVMSSLGKSARNAPSPKQ